MAEVDDRIRRFIMLLNIQKRRLGLSYYAIAKQTSLTPTAVKRYLSGETEPGLSNLFIIADVLNIEITFQIK